MKKSTMIAVGVVSAIAGGIMVYENNKASKDTTAKGSSNNDGEASVTSGIGYTPSVNKTVGEQVEVTYMTPLFQ